MIPLESLAWVQKPVLPLAFLCLSFLICRVGITMVPAPTGCGEGENLAHSVVSRGLHHPHPGREGPVTRRRCVTWGPRAALQSPCATQLQLTLCSPPKPTGGVSIRTFGPPVSQRGKQRPGWVTGLLSCHTVSVPRIRLLPAPQPVAQGAHRIHNSTSGVWQAHEAG